MAQARENVAYDLSLFEPREARAEAGAAQRFPQRPAAEAQPRKKAAPRARQAVRPFTVLKWAAAGVLVMLALLSVMVGNAQINRFNNQAASLRSQLNNAKSEEVQLNVQLESRTSLDNVETYAVSKLGLQKLGPYQIEYVHMMDKDKVELGADTGNIFARVYGAALEYLQRLANSI